GMIIAASIKVPERELVRGRQPLSFDRFFLVPGWRLATNIACFGLSYGVISTYVAIYGQEALGIEGGSGYFFLILACSLIVSRLTGSKSLRQGRISHNASVGAIISLFGYLLFAIVPNEWGYFGAAAIIGLGNGHLYPAYQNMFVDLAPNSRRGTANSSMMISWDLGSGLGIVLAGFILQHSTYMSAFLMAWGFNLVGVLGFFIYAKQHFETHKLR
ncbi:MAG: MFS transporter, partial [Bacteroidales bacterium]|nr:MFS transporter [Bacteroidales bacterium]